MHLRRTRLVKGFQDHQSVASTRLESAQKLNLADIFVPPDQVMDTVNIYTIPGRQRKLSLRFLSWFLLKKDIQTHMHDSIEDAKYALLLYKLYLRFEEDDRFEDVMEDIFVEGQRLVRPFTIGFRFLALTCRDSNLRRRSPHRRQSRLRRRLRHPQCHSGVLAVDTSIRATGHLEDSILGGVNNSNTSNHSSSTPRDRQHQ